ncbi:MAG: hypothetical protein ACOC0E_09535 [Spirochaetota bacterium]
MEVTCLSVPNPKSYLICSGIADVENRGFSTDYRGVLHIHSTGRSAYRGMPDMSRYPVPVIHEFNDFMSRIQEMDASGRYIGIPDHGVRVELKNENAQSEEAVAEYSLLADVYAAYKRDPHAPFFHVKAIIGTVELVDVVEDSDSRWAGEGYKHWILENPVLFSEPITGVSTSRTGLWEYELPAD